MAEVIEYNSEIIMDTMQSEVASRLGEAGWMALTEGIGVPDIEREPRCGCRTMREFMRRFDRMADEADAKAVLTHVRHGLKREQFEGARRKFQELGCDIDAFIERTREEQVAHFRHLCESGEDFYGQPITKEVLEYVLSRPGLLAPVREGERLYIEGFPFDMARYLRETDERKKRYHACHCPFARESILREGEEVSSTLCYCSLGHAKIMWEAMLGTELDGEIETSALRGDMTCSWTIRLPGDVV